MSDPEYALPHENDEAKNYNYIKHGMTLRDYFAAKAMQAWIERAPFDQPPPPDEIFAKWAYNTADAMLKARANTCV